MEEINWLRCRTLSKYEYVAVCVAVCVAVFVAVCLAVCVCYGAATWTSAHVGSRGAGHSANMSTVQFVL